MAYLLLDLKVLHRNFSNSWTFGKPSRLRVDGLVGSETGKALLLKIFLEAFNLVQQLLLIPFLNLELLLLLLVGSLRFESSVGSFETLVELHPLCVSASSHCLIASRISCRTIALELSVLLLKLRDSFPERSWVVQIYFLPAKETV